MMKISGWFVIATAAVACIAAVLLGARLTTTPIATSSGGKPQQVVEKPNAVVPEIVVASVNYVEFGTPWPMPIDIKPSSAVPSGSVLHVRGLPSAITLSEGSRISADTWVVPIGNLSDLDLLASNGAKGESEILLLLVTDDGRVLAEARSAIKVWQTLEDPASLIAGGAQPSPVTIAGEAAEAKKAEEKRKAADAVKKAGEARRLAEAKAAEEERRAEAARKAADAAKKAEEARRLAEAKAAEEERAEAARKAADAAKKAEEARRLAEAKAAEEERAEVARKAAEAKKAEEERKAADAANEGRGGSAPRRSQGSGGGAGRGRAQGG